MASDDTVVSHFLIQNAKHAWIFRGDSAIKSSSHETWNEWYKQPLGLSLEITKHLLYFLAPVLTFKVLCLCDFLLANGSFLSDYFLLLIF